MIEMVEDKRVRFLIGFDDLSGDPIYVSFLILLRRVALQQKLFFKEPSTENVIAMHN